MMIADASSAKTAAASSLAARSSLAEAPLPRTRIRASWLIVVELGFAPLDAVGTQLLFRFVAAAYERRSHWPFEAWGRFIPDDRGLAARPAPPSAVVVVTDGGSFWMKEALSRGGGRRSVS
jgi:hypothetical protein